VLFGRAMKIHLEARHVFPAREDARPPRTAPRECGVGDAFRAHFIPTNPGLKPWAMICSHFVAKAERLLESVLGRAEPVLGEHSVPGPQGVTGAYSFTKSLLLDSLKAARTGFAPGSEAGCVDHGPFPIKARSHSA